MSNIVDTAEYTRQTIDETHEPIVIGGLTLSPSRVVEQMDPTAFRQFELDLIDANVSDLIWYEDENGEIVEAD
jgi:hypothetical protein